MRYLKGFIGWIWQKWNITFIGLFSFVYFHLHVFVTLEWAHGFLLWRSPCYKTDKNWTDKWHTGTGWSLPRFANVLQHKLFSLWAQRCFQWNNFSHFTHAHFHTLGGGHHRFQPTHSLLMVKATRRLQSICHQTREDYSIPGPRCRTMEKLLYIILYRRTAMLFIVI